MSEKVGAALGKNVIVRGLLKYRAEEPYPHAIVAQELRIMPDVSEMASFGDLAGSLGRFIGNLTSSEWLANRRREKMDELLALVGGF